MNKHNRHPALKRRQVALLERNPVCRLCYQICLDLAEDYGGVQFDLLRSLEVADALCERILLNPWELQGVDQYYHWIEGRLGCDRPTMACALATVCVTLRCINNPPAPVKRLARDLKGLIIGDANNLYGELLSTAKRQAISIDADTYGDIPPMPEPQRELQELKYAYAEATTEIQTLKNQLKMEQEQAKQRPERIIHVAGNYIAEMTINNDIHDNHNCRIYATAQPEEKEEAEEKQAYLPPIPEKGAGYNAVREYIEERMKYDEAFRIQWISHTLKQNCIYLSEEFGWVVDEHSLGANLNRHK